MLILPPLYAAELSVNIALPSMPIFDDLAYITPAGTKARPRWARVQDYNDEGGAGRGSQHN